MKKLFFISCAVFFCFSSHVYSGTIDCNFNSFTNATSYTVHAVSYPDTAGLRTMPITVAGLFGHRDNIGATYIIVTNKTESITLSFPAMQTGKEEILDNKGVAQNLYWVDIPDYSNDTNFEGNAVNEYLCNLDIIK